MIPDPEAVAALAFEAAQTIIMPRFGNLMERQITQKGPGDFVTEVDHQTETFLQSRLKALAPDAGFIGEELAAADPGAVSAIAGRGRWWVVDPLDGTRNFISGMAEFGSIIALVENGETVLGVIHAAPLGISAIAVRGEGAVWNGERIKPAPQETETPSGLRSVGWLTPPWRERLLENMSTRLPTRAAHCSAYAYIRLANGEIDFKLSSRIHPWDHAAGGLILSEAGGRLRYLDRDEAYTPVDSADRPLLGSAPGRDHGAIANTLMASRPAN